MRSVLKRVCYALLGLAFLVLPAQGYAAKSGSETVVPRTILAFYDRENEGDPRFTNIHRYLEMPLNHLGYKLKYHNINDPLPPHYSDVMGAIVWFSGKTHKNNVKPWLIWLHQHLNLNRKLLVVGGLGVADKLRDTYPSVMEAINGVLARIGVYDQNSWVNITYDTKVVEKDAQMVEFERKYGGVMPHYMAAKVTGEGVSHLRVHTPNFGDGLSDLIISHPNGGYFSPAYGVYFQISETGQLLLSQWYLNPFRYLRQVFDPDNMPKPDVSTLFGKRVFYSHIDGDAWNSLSEIEEYKNTGTTVSEVLYNEVFKKYSHLPFTVGLVVAELEPSCMGLPKSRDVARKILLLPNIQAGSHTFSHPLMWSYFAVHRHQHEQEYFADYYPEPLYNRFFIADWLGRIDQDIAEVDERLSEIYFKDYPDYVVPTDHDPLIGVRSAFMTEERRLSLYRTPRSFNCQAFNLYREVQGSIDYINALTNGQKPVQLYQWSGNTSPFEAALREVRKAGIGNINGGDSRFDMEYPSYTSVAPIGVEVGKERQIYSSNSNENTYTHRWTERFFGYKFLQSTTENTGMPLRLVPINVYFHTYSAEKLASLSAVQGNIDYVLTRDIIPIFASDYVKMAEGFYRADLVKLGKDHWRILDRGRLQTLRFDKSALKTVDFSQSKGVLGQSYLHGSLYVSLDPDVDQPVVKLKKKSTIGGYEAAPHGYLIQSNWHIRDLQISKNLLSISANGLGEGRAVFKMQQCGAYEVRINLSKHVVIKYKESTAHDCTMTIVLPESEDPIHLELEVADS